MNTWPGKTDVIFRSAIDDVQMLLQKAEAYLKNRNVGSLFGSADGE